MSSSKKPRRATDPQRSQAARRAAEMMKAQQAQARRRTVMVQAGVAALVVVVVLAVTVAILRAQDGTEPSAVPPEVDDQGALVLGNPEAAVTVQVVEDFQCPACRAFEAANGDLLRSYVEGDEVQVAYRGIAFLDRASSTDYSSRSLNASACVMAEGGDVWSRFHRSLFEQQPPEGGEGLSDDQLVRLAEAAGADEDAVRTCVDDGTYADWVASTTTQAGDDGVDGTPTVYVNGEELEDTTALEATVDAALQDAS